MNEENQNPGQEPASLRQQGAFDKPPAPPPAPQSLPPPPDERIIASVSLPQEGAVLPPPPPEPMMQSSSVKQIKGFFGKSLEFLVKPFRDFQLTPKRAAVVIAVVLAGSYWNHIEIKRWIAKEHMRARALTENSIQKTFTLGRQAEPESGAQPNQDFVTDFKLKVVGKPDFQDRIMKALGLIWNRDNETFRQIRKAVYVIRYAEKTDFAVENDAPTILLTDHTVYRSPAWCAGEIGRQFYLLRRYLERERLKHELAVPSTPGKAYLDSIAANPILSDYHDAQSIERMEREADDFQLALMRAVGASSAELLLIEDRQPFDYSLVNDGK